MLWSGTSQTLCVKSSTTGFESSTVKHHLANARSKVGVATTAQLVWFLAERLSEPGGLPQPEE